MGGGGGGGGGGDLDGLHDCEVTGVCGLFLSR